MDQKREERDPIPDNSVLVELRHLDWTKKLSEEALTAITNTGAEVHFHVGEVVIEADSEINHVWILLTGRLHATLHDMLGKEIRKDVFVRGAVIGLFTLGLGGNSYVRVEATEPSSAIRLTVSDLLQLTTRFTDFQLAMFCQAANLFKRYIAVDRSLPKPSVVGIVHHSQTSRPLMSRLVHRLQELDESPCVAGDDGQWRPDGDTPFKLLVGDGGDEHISILKNWALHRRLLVDVRAGHSPEVMMRFLSYVDIVLWCLRPEDARDAIHSIRAMEERVPKWRDKIRIVWLLNRREAHPPFVPELRTLAERGFKLTFDAPGANQGPLLQHGLERIVHHLRGIQIGLALGGGAAHGMAHLGVLNALEQNGIYVDMLAGTSAGAMTGTLYAAGFHPKFMIHFFETDLRPSWLFRRLPGGGYWYLIYKYRRNQFDSMLRKYLGRLTLEQLALPVSAVSVDLVEGEPVVRESGDAVTRILESINLPPLSLPIVEPGQAALVDGGLLNNIPANVLVAKGCNFVIASSVTAKLKKEFVGIRSEAPRGRQSISTIQVMMRQYMIQGYNMNDVGVQPADFVIAPDVTSFDISEFTRAAEMAFIGETTTNTVIGKLLGMLNKLDPKLFQTVDDGQQQQGERLKRAA